MLTSCYCSWYITAPLLLCSVLLSKANKRSSYQSICLINWKVAVLDQWKSLENSHKTRNFVFDVELFQTSSRHCDGGGHNCHFWKMTVWSMPNSLQMRILVYCWWNSPRKPLKDTNCWCSDFLLMEHPSWIHLNSVETLKWLFNYLIWPDFGPAV